MRLVGTSIGVFALLAIFGGRHIRGGMAAIARGHLKRLVIGAALLVVLAELGLGVLLIPVLLLGGGALAAHKLRGPKEARGVEPARWRGPRALVDAAVGGRRQGILLARTTVTHEPLRAAPDGNGLVCGPPRSFKSSRVLAPACLEHRGAALIASTRRELIGMVGGARAEIGEVFEFDPFGRPEACVQWDPVEGCEDWETALWRGIDLTSAARDTEHASAEARYWLAEATRTIQPLVHAVATGRQRGLKLGMPDVLEWIEDGTFIDPLALLPRGTPAAAQLAAIAQLEERPKASTLQTAANCLAVYRFPSLGKLAGPEFTVDGFLEGKHTLFLVSGRKEHQALAPVLVALLAATVHRAEQLERSGRRLDPNLLLCLDEAANIVPFDGLPAALSLGAGNGISALLAFQSLSQMRARWRDEADTILACCATKLFLGPTTDRVTLGYLRDVLGEVEIEQVSKSGGQRTKSKTRRPTLTPQQLQQQRPGRGLWLHAHHAPAWVALNPAPGREPQRRALTAKATP
ncbi:MAG: type IV secretory system conjugative DNA transfer family protein [Actinobacteria bacterium]|nr:MAG: type IV secretory system conjugative DNA transfer family protein [Actinomycetota bacterium]